MFDGLDKLDKQEPPPNPAGVSDEEFYNLTQKGCDYERQIRALKRAKHAFHAAGDKQEERLLTAKIKAKTSGYEAFMDKNGLTIVEKHQLIHGMQIEVNEEAAQ